MIVIGYCCLGGRKPLRERTREVEASCLQVHVITTVRGPGGNPATAREIGGVHQERS
eukprot:COSAG02_NODE_48851_length_331_cov_0.637931_1_plen_56_part_01